MWRSIGEASGNFDSDEIEVTTGSPMGEVLMKAHVGDVVKVDLPRGTKRYEIVEIAPATAPSASTPTSVRTAN